MSQRIAIDTTLATAAVVSPVWVQYTTTYVGLFVLCGGAILLVLRVGLAIREWRSGRNKD